MPNRSLTQPTSVRLSPVTRQRLADAARRTRRSQSELIEETLHRHLDDVVGALPGASLAEALHALSQLKGAGARASGPRSREEIDAEIREMRRDRT